MGMALHHARYSTWKGLTWYLEDLVVTEPWRGQESAVPVPRVAAHARSVNAKRLEWQVLDWDEPADRLLQNVGGVVDATPGSTAD